jgi:hypothetical protein
MGKTPPAGGAFHGARFDPAGPESLAASPGTRQNAPVGTGAAPERRR